MFIVGILVFIIILTISVAIHEAGHMFTAKKFGAGVSEYFIGFGPKIWSTVKNGTEYGVKWIFFGGYCKINSMYPPYRAKNASSNKNSIFYKLSQPVRDEAKIEDEKYGKDKSFYRLKTGQKLAVILAGPFTNLFFAIILIAIAVCGVGFTIPSLTLDNVPKCFSSNNKCIEKTPAYKAGLRDGDTLISVNGDKLNNWDDFGKRVESTPINVDSKTTTNSELEIVYKRNNNYHIAIVKPVKQANRNVIGVVSKEQRIRDIKQLPALEWQQIGGTLKLYASLPKLMFDSLKASLLNQKRGANSLLSIVGVAKISGDIGASSSNGNSLANIISIWLLLGASLNLALWLFNLLPLLPLDGGQAVGVIFEGIRRTINKAKGHKEKIYSDLARLMPLSYFVFIFFIIMSVILIVADLFNPIKM